MLSRLTLDSVNRIIQCLPSTLSKVVSFGSASETRRGQRKGRQFRVSTGDDPVQLLVDEMRGGGRTLRVLEAGAGSRTHIRLGTESRVIGIDISQERLDRNQGLHERILGDIETYPLEPSSFDIIFCWDVLEHLKHPERALESFLGAIGEGGVIVMGSPVFNSVKGMVTKYSPHWFHVFVHRNVLGNKNAGKPGCFPFPTFLKYSMSPHALQRFARKNRLVVEYFDLYEEKVQAGLKKKHWIISLAYTGIGWLLKAATFGYIDPDITDFTMVLRKEKPSGTYSKAS